MPNAGTLSIDSYLATCTQIEEVAAQIYLHWSQSPRLDSSLREFWQQLSQEEHDHANQIEMLRRLTRSAKIGDRAMADDRILKTIKFARNCLVRVKSSQRPTRVALSLAIKMEEHFAHFHANRALVFVDEGLGELFQNLSREDHGHYLRLREIYREYCEAGASLAI